MDNQLRPGPKGDPLPAGEVVFRLATVPKDGFITGQANPEHFVLSTEDKNSIPPSLSVWAERLTRPEQAREFIGLKRDIARLVLYLNVDEIRSLRPKPDSPDAPYLDVVWEPLTITQDGMCIPDPRPGAEGHAGIINLKHPNMSRLHYKSLRSQLADLANKRDSSLLPE